MSEYKGKTIPTHYGAPLPADSVERLMIAFSARARNAALGIGKAQTVDPSVAHTATVWAAHFAAKLLSLRAEVVKG